MYDLGTATLHRIVDVDPFALPLDFLFPGARLEDLRHAHSVLMPHHVDFANGHVLLGIQSFLLRTANLNILIDSCVGEHKARTRRTEWHERSATGYIDRLAAAGVAPHEIDIVLCTHLHADHVGWNTRLESGRWVVVGSHEGDSLVRAEPFDAIELEMERLWAASPRLEE